ncbi:MAG: nucleotidyltransferase family protein [Rhodobacteraceae bacterium]|nr:nucleotidyltransferase family protein [Paracoccaceae bacterium]
MSFDFRANLISPGDTIFDTLKIIDRHGVPVGLVAEDGKLVGVVTDGDIRRGLLRGVALTQNVSEVMNRSPIWRPATISDSEAAQVMTDHGILYLPLLDSERRIVALKVLAHLAAQAANGETNSDEATAPNTERDNPVLIMAGGLGTRFRPLVVDRPKPMLDVAGQPILAHIVDHLVRQGFRTIFMSVNYMREMIEAHFGDGSKFGARIRYLREPDALGTAGALSLLPETIDAPLLVMNGDVLSKVNFGQMLDFHAEAAAPATMAVREYAFTVPYGVIQVEGSTLAAIEEKPEQKFLVNAGIYVLEPAALALIDKNQRLDMPDLFTRIKSTLGAPAVFPLREYWIDIGRAADLIRAHREYGNVFTGQER